MTAILYINQLFQAATNVAALNESQNDSDPPPIEDAQVLKELMGLAASYIKLNPNATTTLGEEIPDFFLNTLWQTPDAALNEKASGEMADFFAGIDNPVELLQSEQRLLAVMQQANVPELTDLLHDPAYVDGLLALGTYYPKTQPVESQEDIFYKSWKATSETQLKALEQECNPSDLPSPFTIAGAVFGPLFGTNGTNRVIMREGDYIIGPLPGVSSYWIPSTDTLFNITDTQRVAFFEALLSRNRKPPITTVYLDVLAPRGALVHNTQGSDSITNILEDGPADKTYDDVIDEFGKAAQTVGASGVRLAAWIEGSGLVLPNQITPKTPKYTNELIQVASENKALFQSKSDDGTTYVDLLNQPVYDKLKEFIVSVARRPKVNEIMLDDHFGIYKDYMAQALANAAKRNPGVKITDQYIRNDITDRLKDLKNSLPFDQKLSISVNPFALQANNDGSVTTSGTAVTLNNQDVGAWLNQRLITGTLNVQIYRDKVDDFKRDYNILRKTIGDFLSKRKDLLRDFPQISVSITSSANRANVTKEDLQTMSAYVKANGIKNPLSPDDQNKDIKVSVVGFDFLKITKAT